MHLDFAGRLGHTFRDPQLLERALTHRSYYFENRAKSPGHFERLEFLGDAVLDLILSEFLMKAYPQVDEGVLSKWRASLVNESTLAEVAREIEIADYIYLGKSEATQRGALRPRLLSSAFEAVLGAVFLDAGLDSVRALIEKLFSSRLQNLDLVNEYAADCKTRLQEISQSRFRSVPEYRVLSADGPEHAKTFTVEVYVNNACLGRGSGQSRKSAEQEAARDALAKESNT